MNRYDSIPNLTQYIPGLSTSQSSSSSSSTSSSGPSVLKVKSAGPLNANANPFTTPLPDSPASSTADLHQEQAGRQPMPQHSSHESLQHFDFGLTQPLSIPLPDSPANSTTQLHQGLKRSSSATSSESLRRFESGLSNTLAGKPLPDSPTNSATKIAVVPLEESETPPLPVEDGMPRDIERADNDPIQQRKRPFSFMITGAARWTWVNALILVISLLAIGCSVTAVVLSVRPHGHGHAIADPVASASAIEVESGLASMTGSLVASTTALRDSSRSSNQPRSVSSLTSAPAAPTPFPAQPEPTTVIPAAATLTSTPTAVPNLPNPVANGAADANSPAASPPGTTTLQPVQLTSTPSGTSFTVPSIDTTISASTTWIGTTTGGGDWPTYVPPPPQTSDVTTHAGFADGGVPFFTHPHGPWPTYNREGWRGGLPGPFARGRWTGKESAADENEGRGPEQHAAIVEVGESSVKALPAMK